MAKQMLDWFTGAATGTRPTARFIGWATGSPDTANDSAGPFTRVTFSPAAASQPAGAASASNRAAMSSRATAVATALGWNMYDASSADVAAFAVGGLKIVLS